MPSGVQLLQYKVNGTATVDMLNTPYQLEVCLLGLEKLQHNLLHYLDIYSRAAAIK
jgi:hypothetical protein